MVCHCSASQMRTHTLSMFPTQSNLPPPQARTIQGSATRERRKMELLIERRIRSITTFTTVCVDIAQDILISGNALPIHIELHGELC